MQPTTADQIASLAFLDVEAKKQSRMFLWIGLLLGPVALGAPVVSLFTDVPFWVAGIMLVCAGLLAAVCLLLAFTRGSTVLAHLRANAGDPVVHARFWVEVQRGVRNLQLVCTTRSGAELYEVLFVAAGPAEEQMIAAVRKVVPRVDIT
jgi:hypothetical protein